MCINAESSLHRLLSEGYGHSSLPVRTNRSKQDRQAFVDLLPRRLPAKRMINRIASLLPGEIPSNIVGYYLRREELEDQREKSNVTRA
ncbi:hypothetical protein EBH_0039350 [Eimeria brunetti]|uniref:Uncharacterized protein n=1 Tax=Eimeria brunetti TaxID=51314 RepID=U6LAQ8_9EIME|nr:hypothetical protein EBH_0039350 [Eimeria brunetti]